MSIARCLVVLLLLGLSSRIASARPATSIARFAIVIGNNEPDGNGAERLRFADDDAVATHQLLLDAGVESHLLVTLDSSTRQLHPSLRRDGTPSLRDLERVFLAISAEMRAHTKRGESTELLLFYSGHGDAEHGEGYVVLEDQHLTRGRLFGLLSRSPATRNHVFVDACKSYFLVYAKGPGGHRTAYSPDFVENAIPGRLANTGFVLSTSSDRESHEWTHYNAGIFSYELRSALRGAADANQDGRISYAELGAFLTVANGDIKNPNLKPDFIVRPPSSGPEREILGWDTRTAALRLNGSEIGHFYVETEDERLLDAHPTAGEMVTLHLPDARPLYVRKDDGSAEYLLTTQRPEGDALAQLTPVEPQVGDKGRVDLALLHLFANPFGPANVRAFEASMITRPTYADQPHTPAASSLGTVAGWTAIGAGGAALTLSTASLVTSLSNKGGSQVEIEQANQRVRTLNIASAVGYAIAGVAGVTWGLCRLQVGAASTAQGSQRSLDARSLGLQLEGRF